MEGASKSIDVENVSSELKRQGPELRLDMPQGKTIASHVCLE